MQDKSAFVSSTRKRTSNEPFLFAYLLTNGSFPTPTKLYSSQLHTSYSNSSTNTDIKRINIKLWCMTYLKEALEMFKR